MVKRSNANLTDEFIHQYLRALDCPRALSVWILYKSGEHKTLSELEFNPLHYNTYVDARDSLAATSILSKAKFLKTGNDLKKIALEKFWKAEETCKESNARILRSENLSPMVQQGLSLARYKIHKILGRFSSCRESYVDGCNWGPGASFHIKRREATYPKKFLEDRGITHSLASFIRPWFREAYPIWDIDFDSLNYTSENKIITVPKNAKTDRTIAIEPGLNIWFQKGIGSIIRAKLGRVGIDLNNQAINQQLALEASRGQTLATIDFSAASDSISRSIVWELLPSDWYAVLDCHRSKFATLEGKNFFYEKFSSMGNGYTFELESLIFYSLAWAACQLSNEDSSLISVYGDDVVIPSSALNIFHQLCDFAGFTINDQKSYSSGYYRESCGSHYWNGQDIKPLFLKESLDDSEELLKCANNVRRLAHRRNGYCGCDARLLRCYTLLASSLTAFPLISDGYGDAGLIENIDHPRVSFKKPKGQVEGFVVRVPLFRPQMVVYDNHGLLLTRLRESGGGGEISYGNKIPLPGRGRKIRKNLLIPRWYDLGQWF